MHAAPQMSNRNAPDVKTPAPAIPTLLTVAQFAEKYPAWSQSAIRNLVYAIEPRKSSRGEVPGNGLDIAVLRLGRKILIDELRFFQWISFTQEKARRGARR